MNKVTIIITNNNKQTSWSRLDLVVRLEVGYGVLILNIEVRSVEPHIEVSITKEASNRITASGYEGCLNWSKDLYNGSRSSNSDRLGSNNSSGRSRTGCKAGT